MIIYTEKVQNQKLQCQKKKKLKMYATIPFHKGRTKLSTLFLN